MMRGLSSVILAATSIVGTTDVGNAAVPFAPATYSFSAFAHDRNVSQTEQPFTGPILERGDIWKLAVVGDPLPVISIQQNSVTDPQETENISNFRAFLGYSFQINAASQSAFDNAMENGFLLINGFTDLSISPTIGNSGKAAISVFSLYDPLGTSTIPFSVQTECFEGNLGGCGKLDFSGAVSLAQFADAGTLSFTGMIWMTAEMQARRYGVNVTNRAIVDPVLSVSGNKLDPSQYTFRFSDGIGNGAIGAVPEPETWSLMVVGIGIVGAALRTRRKPNALV